MAQEQEALETKYTQFIMNIPELDYHKAQDRLKDISQILGDPDIPVEETTQLLRYSNHLVDDCKSFLVPDTNTPSL